jgi:hypothetical protein
MWDGDLVCVMRESEPARARVNNVSVSILLTLSMLLLLLVQSDENNAVCHQLQLVFTHLQYGEYSYFSPVVITELLNIKTSVQQDAQEYVHWLVR